MDFSGAPKTITEVLDASFIKEMKAKGVFIVQGPLNRGQHGLAYFHSNSMSFRRKHGGEIVGYKFPTYCKRLLDAGVKLWIIRSGHYTDASTIEGTKGTATITSGSNNSIWRAEAVGAGYNGTTVVIATAASGVSTKKDITITLYQSDIKIKILDVNQVSLLTSIFY